MTNEQEIERIASAIPDEVKDGCTTFLLGALYGSVFPRIQRGLATALVNAGIGDKKQAVKEAFEKLKDYIQVSMFSIPPFDLYEAGVNNAINKTLLKIDQLFAELYGADKE